MAVPHARRHDPRTIALYVSAMLREFRVTLTLLASAVLFAGLLFWLTPPAGSPGDALTALYSGWMALLNQPPYPPDAWYLILIDGAYPVLGFVLVGEGLIRFVSLMSSRRRGEKEWMRVMASTYRDHIVQCGLGHVGIRVLHRLLESGSQVVAVERDPDGRFLGQVRSTGVPLLVRDMRDDASLAEAGVPHAKAIVIATGDDMANIEVALDARKMNPAIRIVMRVFDQQIAAKLKSSGIVDEAFSTSSLAAPSIAEMALGRGAG